MAIVDAERWPSVEQRRAEVARRGSEIIARVEPTLPATVQDQFIAVDIDSGEYEIDRSDLAAVDRLQARLPRAVIWMGRVGSPTAYGFRLSQ